MTTVYVLNRNGKPLMPTTRCGHVRILLKTKKARVVKSKPFTIQLTYDTADGTQPLLLGIDPGRTNIGPAVVKESGTCVFHAELVTRNKDIPKLMAARKAFRQAHRKLKRRNKRQRRAKAFNTIKAPMFERYLPCCKEPIVCHGIKNKEAKFNNRKRPTGWLTPTANQLLQTHINVVKKLQKFLPISKIVLEVNQFAFMELDNPNIQKWQFQKGLLYQKGSVKDAVNEIQHNCCILCGGAIDHYHHIIPKHENGSNTFTNIVGLCEHCHHEVHTNQKVMAKLKTLKSGLNKKYGALSVLNQIIPSLTEQLGNMLPTFVTTGRDTKSFRDTFVIGKRHSLDAYCIACSILKQNSFTVPREDPLLIKQFRRHDRQACHQQMLDRKYYLDGKLVATNRHKALEQKKNSLAEFRETHMAKDLSNLTVKQHLPRYKKQHRIFPGSVLSFNRQTGILQGSSGKHHGNPDYYIMTDDKQIRPNRCKQIANNAGLMFL